jgi:DNA-binding protein HU-beta
MSKITKAEFIEAISKEVEGSVSKVQIEKTINAAGAAATKILAKGHGLPLLGLGSLNVIKRAARTGRNPRTGAPLKIPASNATKFITSKALDEAIN